MRQKKNLTVSRGLIVDIDSVRGIVNVAFMKNNNHQFGEEVGFWIDYVDPIFINSLKVGNKIEYSTWTGVDGNNSVRLIPYKIN